MKSVFYYLIFMMLVPIGMGAQDIGAENLDFYLTLALKDAKLEQRINLLDAEDEKDFWLDQLRFEKALLAKNPEAYKAYLKGKHIAYARHQKECKGHKHSELYHRQASYYAVKGFPSLEPEAILSAENLTEQQNRKNLKTPK